ncbi:MAG: YkoF family thiamine/hydroxymethylpyrimidine-binding protein [Pseudomonadota bacterium]
MQVSLDISLYPLAEDYIPAISQFIHRLEAAPNVAVVRNDLSTQLHGDYDAVMDLLKQEIQHSFQTFGKSVFVVKFLLDDLRGLADHPVG